MKIYLYISILFIIAFCVNPIYGQTTAEIPSVIPPSPNAQAFVKYDNFPVSNHTGIPDISIPIYTINLKDIKIPITLSYNASGIRVDEEASRIGLGWTLNAGGLITHTVMGRYNDFYHEVYFNTSNKKMPDLLGINQFVDYTIKGFKNTFPCMLPNNMTIGDFWNVLGNDHYDCGTPVELAPDVFNYNFMGYSGKFIFSRDLQIKKEKEDNLIIKPTINWNLSDPKKLDSWLITAPDGTKYYFDQKEAAESSIVPLAQARYNSSFYLTKIVTTGGSEILFLYKKDGNTCGTFNKIDNNMLNGDVFINYSYYENIYLDQIIYPGGKIYFSYLSDRQDNRRESRISSVSIEKVGIIQSIWKFEQGYFSANVTDYEKPTLSRIKTLIQSNASYYDESWNKLRLKLNGIIHSDIANNKSESYRFTYNESQLPTKLSTALDHWGYYNGAYNYSLVPTFTQNISQKAGVIELISSGLGSNRNPSEKLNEAFILKEITYPTGGKTAFTYETNKYNTDNFENDPYKIDFMYSRESVILEEPSYYNNVPGSFRNTVPLNIPYPDNGTGINSEVAIKIRLELSDYYKNWIETDKSLYLCIRGARDTTNVVWNFRYTAPYTPLPSEFNNSNRVFEKTWDNVKIPVGEYNVVVYGPMRKVMNSTYIKVDRTVFPKEFIAKNPVGLGGGLRIKEMKSFDSDGKLLFGKAYKYTTDGSASETNTSGKLMGFPRYNTDHQVVGSNGVRGGGYSVGYSQVYVSDIDPQSKITGYTSYVYVNKPDKRLCYSWDLNNTYPGAKGLAVRSKDENPSGIGGYKYSENGTLLKESIFKTENGLNQKIRETEFFYDYIGNDSNIIWGALKSQLIVASEKTGSATGTNCWDYNNLHPELIKLFEDIPPHADIAFGYIYPAIRPMWVKLKQKIVSDYDGNYSLKTQTDYDYNSTYQSVIKETVRTSDFKQNTIEYKYPYDISNNPVVTKLVTDNRIIDPLEITQKVDNNITFQSVKNYEYYNNVNIPRLSEIKENTGLAKSLETRIKYINYDKYGNPIYITKDDASKVVYLWSYYGQYPIAEIKNATCTEVEAAIKKVFGTTVTIDVLSATGTPDEDKLKDGSLQKELPNALVSTYTFRPFVGILTATGPQGITTYYDYDSFGRLKEAYLKENGVKKILQGYLYHYGN